MAGEYKMTLYLLGKSTLNKSEVSVINHQTIYEYYNVTSQIFLKYCPELYLSEPVLTENKENNQFLISWYMDTAIEPHPCSQEQQTEIYARLAKAIKLLQENFVKDSFERQLIDAVLHIKDQSDILIARDWIILKEWGCKADQEKQVFPVYLPSLVISDESQKPLKDKFFQPTVAKDQKKLLQDQAASIIGEPTQSIVISSNKKRFDFGKLLLKIIAAILFFIIGFLLGWRIIFAERPVKIIGLSLREAQNLVLQKPDIDQQSKNLQNEIIKLEEQLKHPPCDIKETRADPSLNKSLDHPYTPMTSTGKNFQGSLPELLEKSTVFIMAMGDESGSVASGTGFFITPDMIVTNRHVVENAQNNTVMVTNKALGQLKLAHIVSVSQSSQIGGLDLAVLRVEKAPPQQALSFSIVAQPLQDVVAAGYPGIMISQDNAMQRLLKGDLQSIPGVILTKGQINAIQSNAEGEKIMPHSAMVSPGNSGGPLVDLCGRVVGVNTFVTMDQDTSSHGNYAQKSDTIVQVLQDFHIPIQVQSGTCQVGAPSDQNKQDENNLSLDKKNQSKEMNPSSVSTSEKGKRS